MKNRPRKIYHYKFPYDTEIDSCYACPCHVEHVDEGEIECNILTTIFTLRDDQDFPENCPMEETDLPEDFGHR